MRLSVVFELILVFLFLAFAAARVIEKKNGISSTQNSKKLRQGPPNRYCSCTTNMCNCCRDFSLPVVPVKGPGCASVMYLKGDNMMITMSFGERILSNTTIVGSKPKPVCMTLPGGISQFCGRIYGISRTEKNFKACLGLELRALDDIEAALRISCFKFGPKGVSLESAPPIPESGNNEPDEEDEDDDDYDLDDEEEDDDIIGFGGDLDDDEDDESDDEITNNVSDAEDNDVEADSGDYAGFSVLGEDFFGSLFNDDDSRPVKKKKKKPIQKVRNPVVPSTTKLPPPPIRRSTPKTEKSTRRPVNRVVLTSTSGPKIAVEGPGTTVKSAVVPSKSSVGSSPATTTTERSPATQTEKYFSTEHILALPSKEFTSGTTALPVHDTQAINVTVGEKDHTESYHSHETAAPPTNELKLPDLDVEKIEAVVAIAQQGVTPSVLNASSLSANEANKLTETHGKLADKVIAESDGAETIAPFLKVGYVATKFKTEEKASDGYESDDEKRKNELKDADATDGTKSQANRNTGSEEDAAKDDADAGGSNKVKSNEEESEEDGDDYFGETASKDDKGTENEEDYDRKPDEKEDENAVQEEAEDEDDIFDEFISNSETNSVEKDVMTSDNSSNEIKLGQGIVQDNLLSILDDDDDDDDELEEKNGNENQIKMKIERTPVENTSEGLTKGDANKKIQVHDNGSSGQAENLNQTNSTDSDGHPETHGNGSRAEILVESASNAGSDETESFFRQHSFPPSPTWSPDKERVDSQEPKSSGSHSSRGSHHRTPIGFRSGSSRVHRRMNLDRLEQSRKLPVNSYL